ncbi:uncharacterized [Tachysurus ichikawai]
MDWLDVLLSGKKAKTFWFSGFKGCQGRPFNPSIAVLALALRTADLRELLSGAEAETISLYSLPFTSSSFHTAFGISPRNSPYVVKTFIKDGSEHSLQKWIVVETDLNLLSWVTHMFPLTLFSSRHSNL